MLDLGWSEMAIVLVVALLVLGPKELPKLARDLGRWVGKARSLSREFQHALEDMARETELDDMKKQLDEANRELRRTRIDKRIERAVDPTGELTSAFDIDGGESADDVDPPPRRKTSAEASVAADAPAAAEDRGAAASPTSSAER